MKKKKPKALALTQIVLALNFVILGYMLSDKSEYKTIIISLSIIGALACAYEAVRIFRKIIRSYLLTAMKTAQIKYMYLKLKRLLIMI